MATHYNKMSPSDIVSGCIASFKNSKGLSRQEFIEEKREWARGVLSNFGAMDFLKARIRHSNQIEVDVISRILETRAYELREQYIADRPKLWFLDMFRERNLFYPLEKGVAFSIFSTRDYAAGEVNFIGDKTDDWPTEGADTWTHTTERTKYFGKALEYGIFELWESARSGRDILAERTRNVYVDIDEFIERIIIGGAPAHGVQGFLYNKNIEMNTVPASAGPNAPATDWPSKTPEEVISDLYTMRDSVRIDSNYNAMADTLIVSDKRYSYVTSAQIGTNGDTIWGRWLANQQGAINGGMTTGVPFVPFDTAGPGGTPIAIAGTFTRDNVEMPLMLPEMIPVEYHGAKWKIGFAGALGSVNVKRKGRFQGFNGI